MDELRHNRESRCALSHTNAGQLSLSLPLSVVVCCSVYARGIFTSRIPSGIFVDRWPSQSRGRDPTLPSPCEVCILLNISLLFFSSFGPRSYPNAWNQILRSCPNALNQILRVGRKAIFVLQPKAWHPQISAPRITRNWTWNHRYDNGSGCPLGYKPCEHRNIESSLILSCGIHRAHSPVDISYNYHPFRQNPVRWKGRGQDGLDSCWKRATKGWTWSI